MEPYIGMPVTACIGTDKYPYTIVSISPSGKFITLRSVIAKRTDSNGLSEIQEYEFSEDLDGTINRASLRSDGYYRLCNTNCLVILGNHCAYKDPGF